MAKYQVVHGTVQHGGKKYTGDKKAPGKGDTFEADFDARTEKHLLAAGTITKVGEKPADAKGGAAGGQQTKPADAKGGK